MNDPIQDLRDVAANVTANPHHVAIIAAAAVLHLADEMAAFEDRVASALLVRHVDSRIDASHRYAPARIDPPLDHILDETE